MITLASADRRSKTYLGDSVYVGHDGYQLWLWTDNGYGPQNEIALDDEVWSALVAYRQQLLEAASVQS